MIYLIGSLRNPEIPKIASTLRELTKQQVFDDWYAAGPEADDYWKKYEQEKGHDYKTALKGFAARNVFQFDKTHLSNAESVVLALPAGKSGHLELGWSLGKGKRGYILLDSPDRWDVMYQFADMVTDKLEDIANDICSTAKAGLGPVLPFLSGISIEPEQRPEHKDWSRYLGTNERGNLNGV